MDLLSVDIDRNDYYVWERITHYRPRVVVIEDNAMFPPGVDWVIPYDGKAWWDQRTSYWGASLSALERLGRSKGYSLVACSLTGANAFFVRDDLLGDKFSAPYTAEHHYEPTRLYLILVQGRLHQEPAVAAQPLSERCESSCPGSPSARIARGVYSVVKYALPRQISATRRRSSRARSPAPA